jgi:nicotinamide phosphoribosyltransferase
MAAFSVAATEHSIMTSFGQSGEDASLDYLIENMMPENGILSVVGDTWNIYQFVKKIASRQDKIAAKKGTLVIRPDSGKMREVLPHIFADIRDLFRSEFNSKGYRVPKYVKVLQGDGINEHSVVEPFKIGKEYGISADAIMTGSGGGLMQSNIDRDTLKFAFKASNVRINGVDMPIAKNPITDPGKMSKMGRLMLLKDGGHFNTVGPDDCRKLGLEDQLRLVYEDGKTFNMESLATIRERLAQQ